LHCLSNTESCGILLCWLNHPDNWHIFSMEVECLQHEFRVSQHLNDSFDAKTVRQAITMRCALLGNDLCAAAQHTHLTNFNRMHSSIKNWRKTTGCEPFYYRRVCAPSRLHNRANVIRTNLFFNMYFLSKVCINKKQFNALVLAG